MNKLGGIAVGQNYPVRIMGIVNTSPESFYKNSIATKKQKIVKLVRKMENDGADFLDVGGMSTAPYRSTLVSEKIESKRIVDAVKTIQKISNLPISVDTCRAAVAQAALKLGVEIINDISGLKYDKNMIKVIEKFHLSMILCAFNTTQVVGNPVQVTKTLLRKSLNLAKDAGISRKNIVLDPAIGFFRRSGKGKFFTKIKSDWIERDLVILRNLKSLRLGQPQLVSVSNKSFIGKLLKKENPSDRIFGSIAAETIAVLNGANIIRTHNVSETKDAITIAQRIAQNKPRKAYNAS